MAAQTPHPSVRGPFTFNGDRASVIQQLLPAPSGPCPPYTPFADTASPSTPAANSTENLPIRLNQQWIRDVDRALRNHNSDLQMVYNHFRDMNAYLCKVEEYNHQLRMTLEATGQQVPHPIRSSPACRRELRMRRTLRKGPELPIPHTGLKLTDWIRRREEAVRFTGYALVDEARLIASDFGAWCREKPGEDKERVVAEGEAPGPKHLFKEGGRGVRTFGQFLADERSILRGDYHEWRRVWKQGNEPARGRR